MDSKRIIELKQFARNCDKFIVELGESVDIIKFNDGEYPVDNFSEKIWCYQFDS